MRLVVHSHFQFRIFRDFEMEAINHGIFSRLIEAIKIIDVIPLINGFMWIV